MGPGTRIDVSGTGAGPYITGGDEYGSTVARTTGAADPAAARGDFDTGTQADANLGKLTQVGGLYKQFVAPNTNPGGILTEEMTKKLSDATGVDFTRFTNLHDVKAEIRPTFASMVANMRDNMGQPMFKGGLDQIMQQFPDPTSTLKGSSAASPLSRRRCSSNPPTARRRSNTCSSPRRRISTTTCEPKPRMRKPRGRRSPTPASRSEGGKTAALAGAQEPNCGRRPRRKSSLPAMRCQSPARRDRTLSITANRKALTWKGERVLMASAPDDPFSDYTPKPTSTGGANADPFADYAPQAPAADPTPAERFGFRPATPASARSPAAASRR